METYVVNGVFTVPSLDSGKTGPTEIYFALDVKANDAQEAIDAAEKIVETFTTDGYKIYSVEREE